MVGRVQVGSGATLTIEAGAEVHLATPIELEGGLRAVGTPANPVAIHVDQQVFTGVGSTISSARVVEIRYADITGPGTLSTGFKLVKSYTLTDSTITDLSEQSTLYAPKSLLFERNVFTRVDTFEVLSNVGDTATFRHNRFRVQPPGGFGSFYGISQIVARATYGDPVRVVGNVFGPERPAGVERHWR